MIESPSLTIVTLLICFPKLFTKFTLVPDSFIKSRYLLSPNSRLIPADSAGILPPWEICEAKEQKTQDLFDHFTQFLLAKSIIVMDCKCDDCISTSPQHPKFTDHGKVIFEDGEKIKVIVDEFLAVYKEKSGYNSIPNHISELQQIKHWDNGELKTIFDMNGNLFLEFYENGNLKKQYDKDGKLIGECYENGNRKFVYWENGQLREEYGKDDELIGDYDENGKKRDNRLSNKI